MRDSISGGALTETTFLILLSLYTPLHGYGVKTFIKEKTMGRIDLGAGTVYGAINNLNKKGWIELCDKDENDRRKNVFVITKEGKRILDTELLRLQVTCKIAEKVIAEQRNQDAEWYITFSVIKLKVFMSIFYQIQTIKPAKYQFIYNKSSKKEIYNQNSLHFLHKCDILLDG